MLADRPQVRELPGGRLHLSHGPIDVVLRAWGEPDAIEAACRAAAGRFGHILPALCRELPRLRAPIGAGEPPESPVGRRMAAACRPFADVFVTPMAAVAGAVADELMAVMRDAAELERAYVNDGGDIAVYCAPGTALDIGIAGSFGRGPVPRAERPGAHPLRRRRGRHRHLRRARPLLLARHRRFRHGAGRRRGDGRCGGDAHCQRGRYRAFGHRPPARLGASIPTATSATASSRSPSASCRAMPCWRRWRRDAGASQSIWHGA